MGEKPAEGLTWRAWRGGQAQRVEKIYTQNIAFCGWDRRLEEARQGDNRQPMRKTVITLPGKHTGHDYRCTAGADEAEAFPPGWRGK